MGFDLSVGISAVTVFLQGLLSVFSPCVLPLIPLYIGYLAGGTAAVHPRRRVLVNTLFFVLGISFAFFLLGMGFTALGRFFSGNRTLFTRCSGVLILVFGLYQLGIFGRSSAMDSEHRFPAWVRRCPACCSWPPARPSGDFCSSGCTPSAL